MRRLPIFEDKLPSHKFPVTHRLVHSHEFDQVFKQCEFRISLPELLFLAKPNDQGFNRLGMVVSKKSVPLAVHRNRIKRQIREVFRTLTDNPVCLDVIVLTRPKVRNMDNLSPLLADSLKGLCTQAEKTASQG